MGRNRWASFLALLSGRRQLWLPVEPRGCRGRFQCCWPTCDTAAAARTGCIRTRPPSPSGPRGRPDMGRCPPNVLPKIGRTSKKVGSAAKMSAVCPPDCPGFCPPEKRRSSHDLAHHAHAAKFKQAHSAKRRGLASRTRGATRGRPKRATGRAGTMSVGRRPTSRTAWCARAIRAAPDC